MLNFFFKITIWYPHPRMAVDSEGNILVWGVLEIGRDGPVQRPSAVVSMWMTKPEKAWGNTEKWRYYRQTHDWLVGWNHGILWLSIQLGIIIPTDELIFFRGVETTNQMNSTGKHWFKRQPMGIQPANFENYAAIFWRFNMIQPVRVAMQSPTLIT